MRIRVRLLGRRRRPLRAAFIAAGLMLLVAVAGAAAWIAALGPPVLGDKIEFSTLVLDRDGQLLRPYATSEGRWRVPATPAQVDPRYLAMLLAYEDKRFRSHRGVDPVALTRAFFQLVTSGHIVSGGSTLTMQVARLLEPRHERTLLVKLREIVRAIELERALSKDQILSLYLGLAPFGGNLEGVRAASLAYFGKEPRRLTLAEAALLVALPQSPEARRPDRSTDIARKARDRVLDRVARAVDADAAEVARAKAEPVPAGRRALPALAPHAADEAVAEAPTLRVHRLTLDAHLQRSLEQLVRERVRTLGAQISVGLVAIDNETGEVRARIGSPDYFDSARAGQVDMTRALRSPGSTLKPFIYGLAFEDGLVHPETMIEDRPVSYGAYAPKDFDLTFQGTVTVRHALQFSLNVPAVMLLDRVGANRLMARLGQAGAQLVLPKGEVPGLAMGLGGVGVRLSDLTMLYAGLARLGTTLPLAERLNSGPAARPQRLMEPVAAWYVGNVLIGAPPPENAVRGRIAYKTGTSYGYRDAWAVGYDGKLTIGVWVGRPDGAPVPGLIGRIAAAPILFDAFARIGRPPAPLAHAPKGVIFAATAKLPPPLQRFRPAGFASAGGTAALKILYPPNGAQLDLRDGSAKPGPLALKVAGGVQPLTVLVNGVPAPVHSGSRTLFYEPDGPGFVRLTVMDAKGASDSVLVRVQ